MTTRTRRTPAEKLTERLEVARRKQERIEKNLRKAENEVLKFSDKKKENQREILMLEAGLDKIAFDAEMLKERYADSIHVVIHPE